MRIGQGYDIHRLKKGRKLFIGGVRIPFPLGLFGHSDADVLLHAVCDGLLGAAGLGDIGEYFPDTDSRYKNASSVELAKKIYARVKNKGFAIINIDCILFAEQPKLVNYKSQIKKSLARILNINKDSINLKAKTMEQLDDIGAKKAIAASCVVLLKKIKDQ